MSNHSDIDYIGSYRILAEIGRGGMATVYKVCNAESQVFALKLLHEGPHQDVRWGTRFQREFSILSRLRHPHLIAVHDYGEDHDRAYYVMDYIDGETLWTFYRDYLRLQPTAERLRWLLPLTGHVVSALDYIHRHRVVHQDLKPANILLQRDAKIAYLADFGLAREIKGTAQFTHAGFIGTLGYAAPEIVERRQIDGRTDIYALGIILYTLLADRRPIAVEGRSIEQLINSILREEPVPLQDIVQDIPIDVANIIHRCMQKNPAQRYSSTRELWQILLPLIMTSQQNEVVIDLPYLPPEEHYTPQQVSVASKIIGRAEEISICQSRLEQFAGKKASGVLLFYGIPGIGKSFLLQEISRIGASYCLHLYQCQLSPSNQAYQSLSEVLSILFRDLPSESYASEHYKYIAHYCPDLPNLPAEPLDAIPTLVDHVNEIAKSIVQLLAHSNPVSGQIWLIDDLQYADSASQDILRQVLLQWLNQPPHPLLFISTYNYKPGGVSPSFRLPNHPSVDIHHILPFSEEEEISYIEQMLGHNLSDEEYKAIREHSRGIPSLIERVIQQQQMSLHKRDTNFSSGTHNELYESGHRTSDERDVSPAVYHTEVLPDLNLLPDNVDADSTFISKISFGAKKDETAIEQIAVPSDTEDVFIDNSVLGEQLSVSQPFQAPSTSHIDSENRPPEPLISAGQDLPDPLYLPITHIDLEGVDTNDSSAPDSPKLEAEPIVSHHQSKMSTTTLKEQSSQISSSLPINKINADAPLDNAIPTYVSPEGTAITQHPKHTSPEGTAITQHPKHTPPEGTAITQHPKHTPPEGTAITQHPKHTPPEGTAITQHPKHTKPEGTAITQHPKHTPPEGTAITQHPKHTKPEGTAITQHPKHTKPDSVATSKQEAQVEADSVATSKQEAQVEADSLATSKQEAQVKADSLATGKQEFGASGEVFARIEDLRQNTTVGGLNYRTGRFRPPTYVQGTTSDNERNQGAIAQLPTSGVEHQGAVWVEENKVSELNKTHHLSAEQMSLQLTPFHTLSDEDEQLAIKYRPTGAIRGMPIFPPLLATQAQHLALQKNLLLAQRSQPPYADLDNETTRTFDAANSLATKDSTMPEAVAVPIEEDDENSEQTMLSVDGAFTVTNIIEQSESNESKYVQSDMSERDERHALNTAVGHSLTSREAILSFAQRSTGKANFVHSILGEEKTVTKKIDKQQSIIADDDENDATIMQRGLGTLLRTPIRGSDDYRLPTVIGLEIDNSLIDKNDDDGQTALFCAAEFIAQAMGISTPEIDTAPDNRAATAPDNRAATAPDNRAATAPDNEPATAIRSRLWVEDSIASEQQASSSEQVEEASTERTMIAHRIEDEEASTERTMIAHRIEDEEASTEQASAAPRVEDEEASTEQASAAPRVEDEEASTERTMIAHRIEDEEASTEQASAAPRAMGEEISTERTTAAPESQGLLMRGGAIKSAYNPLDRLEPVQRNQLVFASYLAENFTCNELAAVLGISQQEAIDIIKTTLSLRILVIHPSTVDACYSFLYPSYRKILTDGLPIEHRRELAYKAALAMSQQREQYHRQHNASLLARRFTEGQQPVESLRWQLYAVEQAFASQVENALQEALRQLRELLLHWSVKGATKQLLHAVPRLIASRKSQTNSIWEQTINHLLSQGILQNLNLSLLARHQATVTRQSLETLIVEVRRKRPDALDLLHKRLSPLLQFAQVEFTS